MKTVYHLTNLYRNEYWHITDPRVRDRLVFLTARALHLFIDKE